ncbi:MAG: hypothetical protein A2583_14085 [Bdellovibrionales bacterium RIFOXYD1_FULL_53_11]|nr:MAG: hypothetical protein A2583_14085 [Bdellovibrionales bacterium RIFOXYD1_FULL_53_11]
MLTHKYQNWYTELIGVSTWQWYGILAIVLMLAGLSVINPQFFKILAISAGKRIWRGFWRLISFRGPSGGGGIEVVDTTIPDIALLRHTHIVGATGTGKSALNEHLICLNLARGCGALIIDPKGDRQQYVRIRDYCRSIGRGRHLHYLSASWPEESVRWNPCSLGNASELQSKWFNSGVYREPFYAKACELGLLEAFNALIDDRPKHFSMADLVSQLKKQAGDGKQQNMQGLFLDVNSFAKSEWGPLLCMPQGVASRGRPVISLMDITSRNEILYVDLPTEAKAVQSSRVGKLLLQEMMLVSGLRKLHPEIKSSMPFAVYVDEFDAFATENFATFLNKGRSSDFMITLVHQTLSDLERVSKTFKGQVMGNCNVRFIFRQDDSKDAEEWAKYLGTKKIVKKTFRTSDGMQTGESSNRESEEFIVHPNEIKTLRVGGCILSMKTERVLKRMSLPFPLKQPERRGGILERETPMEQECPANGGEQAQKHQKSLKNMNSMTGEQGTILEAARQDGVKKKVRDDSKPPEEETNQ